MLVRKVLSTYGILQYLVEVRTYFLYCIERKMVNSTKFWPPADWDNWPETRVGALIFDAVVLVCVVVYAVMRTQCPRQSMRPCSNCKLLESVCHRFMMPIFIGFLCGIWLHFIPCIWWTCDWGDNDGEGIRGGIWFVTWGIVTVVLWLSRSWKRQTELQDERAKTQMP